MRTDYKHNGIMWIDLESPTKEEVSGIVDQFGVSTMVAEELLVPSMKPRTEFYDSYVYVVLHFPSLRRSHRPIEQEIDFIVGRDFIITTHYDIVDPLHKFSKVFEVNSLLDKSNMGNHAGFFFFYMLKKLYKGVEYEVERVRHHLSTIEGDIFTGHEAGMVEVISRAARDLLNLRQIIEPHREVLRTIEAEGARLFGEDFMPYLRALSNDYYRVHNHVMRNTESLHELRETNNSLLSTKENETMRVLTIMALLTFPLSLLVAIMEIDSVYNPIKGQPYDFWIVVGIVLLLGSSMIAYFKHRKWF
ncbi:MAG: CorA family divalent cation transporter [bacterium]|nr:CorA family divalent cation transporter [bacterium]